MTVQWLQYLHQIENVCIYVFACDLHLCRIIGIRINIAECVLPQWQIIRIRLLKCSIPAELAFHCNYAQLLSQLQSTRCFTGETNRLILQITDRQAKIHQVRSIGLTRCFSVQAPTFLWALMLTPGTKKRSGQARLYQLISKVAAIVLLQK